MRRLLAPTGCSTASTATSTPLLRLRPRTRARSMGLFRVRGKADFGPLWEFFPFVCLFPYLEYLLCVCLSCLLHTPTHTCLLQKEKEKEEKGEGEGTYYIYG